MSHFLAYAAIAAGMLMLSPFILAIALMDWWHLWRKGPAPSPFVPEHPDSWADTMERGRRIQQEEERNG